MKRYLTACPRNCYSTCSFIAEVDDNRVIAIYPDKDNMAVPEGPCIKGLSYIERAVSPDRITTPMVRNSDGSFSPVTYNEALKLIAEKLDELRGAGMQKSLFYYTGSGMSGLTNSIGYNFFRLFGGATTTYGNYCWPAGLEAVRLTLGEIKHNVPWDIENAGTIILWGKNSAETNIQEIRFINRAAERGAKIIVIDPRRTATADRADMWVAPIPGTDAALALAICRILIEQDRTDKLFIDKYVVGFDDFRESLNLTLPEASEITGVASNIIMQLAEIIGSGAPLTIIPGYGLQRYSNGGQTIRSILALNIITGNLGKSGTGFNYANLQGYIFDSLKEPLSYYPDINPDPLFRRGISIARLGEEMAKISSPGLKMAWIERGNPLTQAADTNLVEEQFRKLEFVVVVDQFMNDTTEVADLVLPAKNMFEQQDIISSYWSPYIFYRPRITTCPGEILPEPEIFYHLAMKMGIAFSPDDIPDPGEGNLDRWLAKRIAGCSDLTLDDLKDSPQMTPGLQHIAYSDYRFTTPSGKIELVSETAEKKWGVSSVPSYKALFREEETSYNYHFITPNNRNRIHSQFGNLEIIRENDPFPVVQISIADAKRLGVADNDMVRIFNERGEIRLRAEITARISEGSLSVPNGWWKSEGAGGNQLSAGGETDMGFGTAFHNTMVSIEKV